ncbi:hypothetical protein EIN_284000 [Entamoeba invadens IP1]|uniref:Uncharacterized protein n=1 Tax=Entamoeba invadens IP1 TaxID=370355 RepID=L7FKM6_ENTIV|nr:hypothetical protein EIN_284000 [Entamoeba invadens IP1]ELP84844.1 hypothetical protein EIN_284000 [Entamoeba invadens IP1]|eukprot:XP_004184190.1 hypothetical protein EIN_284000 [Entamoeba invadens IP1]
MHSSDNPSGMSSTNGVQKSQVNSKKDQFTKSRNWQSQQVSFLIALLSLKYNITFEKPSKLPTKSLTIFKAVTLTNEKDFIDVKKLTENRIKKLIESDERKNINEKIIRRRLESYRIMEHLHVLMDFIKGDPVYSLQCKDDKHTTLQDRRVINTIAFDGFVYDKKAIKAKGTKVQKIMMDRVKLHSANDAFKIDVGDTEIMTAILL